MKRLASGEEEAGAGPAKRGAGTGLVEGWDAGLREVYRMARPYGHAVAVPVGRPLLEGARAELLAQGGLAFKETDLFRLRQGMDLANLDQTTCPPHLWRLRNAINSPEFRRQVEEITGCRLNDDRVDMAGNVYQRGSHLGCHDDCISTRTISYILYLSDEPWTEDDGGALELYGPDSYIPEKTILPHFGTMVLFHVDAGVSVHAVQEVYSSTRRRISFQGWFHTKDPILNRDRATLSSLTEPPPADAVPRPMTLLSGAVNLAEWVAPQYLTGEAIKAMAAHGTPLLLQGFLLETKYSALWKLMKACDALHDFDGSWKRPDYSDGVSEGWTLTGPPYKQRFLELDASQMSWSKRTKLGALSEMLAQLRKVFASVEFSAWMKAIATPNQKDALWLTDLKVRRFRPGLDYKVADHADRAPMVATWCAVADNPIWETGEMGGHEIFSPSEDASTARSTAEVYEGENADIVSICPKGNCFSIVRTGQMLGFVQYVNRGAPSSRFDIATTWYEPDKGQK